MTLMNSRIDGVPTQNSAANSSARDVIGNKTDTHDGDSLFARIHTIEEHIHTTSFVYPTLAASINVVDGGAAWTLGAFTQIVPAATIIEDFDIHWIAISQISAVDVYELHLFCGAADTFIGAVRFSKTAVMENTNNVPFFCPIIPASDRIRAKLASGAGGKNVDISVMYHTY